MGGNVTFLEVIRKHCRVSKNMTGFSQKHIPRQNFTALQVLVLLFGYKDEFIVSHYFAGSAVRNAKEWDTGFCIILDF